MSVIANQYSMLRTAWMQPAYLDELAHFLGQLSDETRRRFGPHPYDRAGIQAFYQSSIGNMGLLVMPAEANEVMGYTVLKKGFLTHDFVRLLGYGLTPSHHTDCTMAPVVADAWQGHGVGNFMMAYLNGWWRQQGFSRVWLWGGVQCSNFPARQFYAKHGFTVLGTFEHQGCNEDMVLFL
jgi:diamine N-acetyltransferase